MEKNLLPKLRVSVSEKCQLRCSFCGGHENKMENFQPDYMNKMLSTEKLIRIIEMYIKKGGKYVQFTGGETLLREDIEYLVSRVYGAGGIPEINTNGIALTYEKALKLKESGINIIKVSVPSFNRDKYKKITGVDALEKVLKNISNIVDIVNIRINIVATKDTMVDIKQIIEVCRKLKVKQILLLELLYYPHVEQDNKIFEEQYVNTKKEYGSVIEEIIGAPFVDFEFNNRYETKLFVAHSPKDDMEVYIKQANPVLRLHECYKCDHFCQEGVYELRVSTGGYINFCNICNEFGVDVSNIEDSAEIGKVFDNYSNLLCSASPSDFKEFVQHHGFAINRY